MRASILCVALMLIAPAARARAQLFPIPEHGSPSAQGSHVFAGLTFSGVTITWQTAVTARYVMLFDGTALPSNGSTTSCTTTQAAGCLAFCEYVPTSTTAPNSFNLDFGVHPVALRNGAVVAMSTGAGCGTLTVDTTSNFFYGQVR